MKRSQSSTVDCARKTSSHRRSSKDTSVKVAVNRRHRPGRAHSHADTSRSSPETIALLDSVAERTSVQLHPMMPTLVDDVATTTSSDPFASAMMRTSQSAHSSIASSSIGDICRICHCEASIDTPLIMPCYCSGSLRFVHQKCLQIWIKSSQTRSCEVCRYSFIMQSKLKPLTKWEKLDISAVERRKIVCSVSFHLIAITCVVWSLYVLIDRTLDEIRIGQTDWPFWTKLVVVAIGLTGGLVFMYVQCKMYAQLFARWKTYNKVIYVQNCPEMCRGTGTNVVMPTTITIDVKSSSSNHL